MEQVLPFLSFLIFLGLGYGFGQYFEKRHYQSITKREKQFLSKPAVTFRKLPDARPVQSVHLATGSVVISVDHFKRFLAGLRLFFGGEIRSYSSLIDRARREALLRMKESCPNAELFINTRLETSTISKGGRKQKIGSVEILAYSTAVVYADGTHSQITG